MTHTQKMQEEAREAFKDEYDGGYCMDRWDSSVIDDVIARVVRETLEEVEHLIDDRLPDADADEMTDAEMEEYHCEGSILYWGKHLRSAITKLKNKIV